MTEANIPQLDLSSTLDYSKLKDPLKSELDRFDTANQTFSSLGGTKLAALFEATSPDAFHVLRQHASDLDDIGTLVLHRTEIDTQTDQLAQLSAIAIAAVYGMPTRTDQKNSQIAWPIKFDPDTTLTRTFSQSLGEAAYHTDTQYYAAPEKYFGLFCITADEDGKGTNHLLDGLTMVKTFTCLYGPTMAHQLTKPFPFKVPSVFTKHAEEHETEITWAPVFDEAARTIRYRYDTILGALATSGVKIDDEQRRALDAFGDLLSTQKPIAYHLQPGDAVLVNNHRMLHARTSFDNPERFLYRVRMSHD